MIKTAVLQKLENMIYRVLPLCSLHALSYAAITTMANKIIAVRFLYTRIQLEELTSLLGITFHNSGVRINFVER